MITYCAIQAALCAQSPVRCLITDELKNIDDENLPVFLGATMAAIDAGLFDMMVGTEPGREDIYRAITHSSFTVKEIG